MRASVTAGHVWPLHVLALALEASACHRILQGDSARSLIEAAHDVLAGGPSRKSPRANPMSSCAQSQDPRWQRAFIAEVDPATPLRCAQDDTFSFARRLRSPVQACYAATLRRSSGHRAPSFVARRPKAARPDPKAIGHLPNVQRRTQSAEVKAAPRAIAGLPDGVPAVGGSSPTGWLVALVARSACHFRARRAPSAATARACGPPGP